MPGANALLLAAMLSAGPFVAADVLTVRAGPDTSSAAIDQLRINEEVDLAGEPRAGWVELRAPTRGWVRAEFLRPTALTADDAVQAAAKASGEARLAWLERAVAIEPTRVQHWRRLLAGYERRGALEQARRVTAALRGELPLYVLLRGEELGWQVVAYTPGRGWRPVLLDGADGRPARPSGAGLDALRTGRIIAVNRDSATPLAGAPLRGLALEGTRLHGAPQTFPAGTCFLTQPWVPAPAREADDAAVLGTIRDAALREEASSGLDVVVRVVSSVWLSPLDATAPVRLGITTWSVSYVERGDPRHQLKSMTREGLALTVQRGSERQVRLFPIGTVTD